MECIVAFAVMRWNIVIGMSMVFNNYSIYNRAASCFKCWSSVKVHDPRRSSCRTITGDDHDQMMVLRW
jgi:hypothetical protein